MPQLRTLSFVSALALLLAGTNTVTALREEYATATPSLSSAGGIIAAATDAPALDTCSVDNGCPLSAMAYATGTFTDEFLLSDAALQSASNLTLHIHLCCGYKIGGELLVNMTTYERFLVELLHVSPLAHLSLKEQLAIFPHKSIVLTKQGDADTPSQRIVAGEYALGTDPDRVPDGDILTLVAAPQGPNFRLSPPSGRYANQRANARPAHVEHYGIDYDLTYDDVNKRLEGGNDYHSSSSSDVGDVVTEFQMFIPNFAIKCKCPHTLPVLPLLRYRRDTLPPLALEGLGAKCITNDEHTTALGPWSRVLYAMAGSHAHNNGARNAQQRYGNNALRTASATNRLGDNGNNQQQQALPPLTPKEFADLHVTADTIIASTFFSLAPVQLPPFTRLQWRLYEVSESLMKALSEATAAGTDGAASNKHDGENGYNRYSTDYGTETELYGKDQQQHQEGGENKQHLPYPASIAEHNYLLQFPNETAYKLLASAEQHNIKNSKAGGLRKVAESDMTTNVTQTEGISERFNIKPNTRYLVTVDVRRGEARQVLRGLFVLRLPAWLTHPARFLLPNNKTANGMLKPIGLRHNHMLFGRDMQLGFAKFAMNDDAVLQQHYRRVWAPMVSANAERIRGEQCLAKFKSILRQRDDRTREHQKAIAGSSTSNGMMMGQPVEGQHSDYAELFASVEARAKLHAMKKHKLEAELAKEADRLHSIAMADATCKDIFSLLEEQMRRGQPLRVGDDDAVRYIATGDNSNEIVPEQFRHLRDPTQAMFSYDMSVQYDDVSGDADATTTGAEVLTDHIEDGAWFRFPIGISTVSVWLVDEDGACNATRVEVAKVHALHAAITRPAVSPSTICTRQGALEAASVEEVVASAKATFPALAPTASASPFESNVEWTCYDETASVAELSSSSADQKAIDAHLKAKGVALNVSNKKALAASVTVTPQTTARCFWTIKATNVPKLDANTEKWLHIDPSAATVARGPSYFTPSQDLVLEDNTTIKCRAFWLPLQVFVDVDTKDAFFTVAGLPADGQWSTNNNAPVRHISTNKETTATFELLDNEIFDIALDEEKRAVADRTYALRHNTTGGKYAYVVLAAKSLLYTIRYDESGTCPEGEVEVVVRLTQTPPSPVSPVVEELFIEEPCVLLERPRPLTSDEVSLWAPTMGVTEDTREYFGDKARGDSDVQCAASMRMTLHSTEEGALNGEAGTLITSTTPRRAANGKRYVRVCGIPQGTSCGVQWSASNAAGVVSKTTVVHRCRLPPSLNFYTQAPALKAASTFSRRMVYESTHKLTNTLTIAGNISLFPIAGTSTTLHYRLADSTNFAHTPNANDHTITDAGRMKIYIEYDSAARYPYAYNVTAVSGVKPFEMHANTHAYAAAIRASAVNNNRNHNELIAFKDNVPTDIESIFGSGNFDLSCLAGVTQNDAPAVCTATFIDLGNTTRQLFVATIEVERNSAAVSASSSSDALSTQSLRVRDEFQKRKLCRTSHQPFALYTLAPETVLSLQEHPTTRAENAGRTGHPNSTPLALRFCTPQYHFVVTREMYSVLGYDFTFACPTNAFKVQKVSETETIITPTHVGTSAGRCTFTVYNHASNTKDAVAVDLQSVTNSESVKAFNIYLLPDVREDVTALDADAVAKKYPSVASGAANNNQQQQQQARKKKPLTYRNPHNKNTDAVSSTAAPPVNTNGALVAVGRSVDLLAYSRHVMPFSGAWRVTDVLPARDTFTSSRRDAVLSASEHLKSIRVRETTATDFACVDQCVGGTMSNIPVSGFYTVGYDFPDTNNADICPPSNVTRTVHVFLAEALTSEITTCVPNVTISAVPLPAAHRVNHYGQWSIVTYHTSPTEVSPYPEEFITFDNANKDTTTVRGLRFGVLRLRWSIYREGTDEPLDSVIVTIKVLTDSLPADRVVTFKDAAMIQTTSSTINWRATRPNIRVAFRPATVRSDPSISGEIVVSQLPLGTTRLRYDAVKSSRAAQFPALAHLKCPAKSHGEFFVERVAASLTAGTTMRVECNAYSGQGVITLRLATGGSDDIKFVGKEELQGLIFNGTARIQQERPKCRVPWWAREGAVKWADVAYFNKDRAVNITVRATEYLSRDEVETVPMFATSGIDCPESGGFVSSAVIEGVPHEGSNALFVPIVDPVSARLHSNFHLRPIEGQRLFHSTGESQLSKGNATVDIALTRGASFGFRSNESLLMTCLRGEVPMNAFTKAWSAIHPTGYRGQQSWSRYVDAAGNLMVRCEPLVFLPHGSSAQSMTIRQLEDQLQVIHQDTVQTLRNRDGIDVHGLSRSTQMALAARRVTSAQLAEILHRNRRMEAERLARAQTQETDAERFDRVMRLSSSVFGEDAVVTAVRVSLPAFPPFFTTEDILLNIQVAKATVCSIPKDDPEAPSNSSGFGQSSFGQLLIEDEPTVEEVTPNAFSQCQFESRVPAFHLSLRNGAFRPDASIDTCKVELIDDGIINSTLATVSGGSDYYVENNNGRGPISSLHGGSYGASSRHVGLHACFESFLKGATFHNDLLSQKKVALQLAACPQLTMIDLEEYNSYEPLRRTAFFRRMTQPHHMRIVLKNCIIPDKHTIPAGRRSSAAAVPSGTYVDGTFNVVIQPTMAHLRVLSARSGGAGSVAQQQIVDSETSELDRLVLCEGDVQERGALLGIELSGDKWHNAVGERPNHGGHGSRNVAMLNSFSVVEKEEYLMMERGGESIYDRRARIARLVDSRYDTSDDTFGAHRERYEDLAHASSGAHATSAVKVSKFMHYMYQQFWAQQNRQSSSYADIKPLVTRFNDSFVTVQIPEDSTRASRQQQHTMQAYQRTNGYEGGAIGGGIIVDSKAWGFGGVVEEVRIAIPGVTTTCNACLLTDMNFFFVGDFAGSISLFSQRAVSQRMMAERSQLEAPLRLALTQLSEDRPIVFYHHWMCPSTVAKRLTTLTDIVKGGSGNSNAARRGGSGSPISGPIVELVVQFSLGQDTPDMRDLQSDELVHISGGEFPSPAAAMRTSIVFRNATDLITGMPTAKLEATVVMRSAQAAANPARLLHELEVPLQFLPETLAAGHKAIAAAMKKRKARLGYGARPQDLAFNGVVTLRTCVNDDPANCMETASRGIVVGPWEAEVAPVVTPTHGATTDRSYVAESQRHMNHIVHTVRSGFVTFALFVLHHIVTAYVILRIRRNAAARNAGPRLNPATDGARHLRGQSPDPIHAPPSAGYAAPRNASVSLSDLDKPTGSNTLVFIGSLFVAALMCRYTFALWVMSWLAMWVLVIVAQRGRNAVTVVCFAMHFLVFLAAMRQ